VSSFFNPVTAAPVMMPPGFAEAVLDLVQAHFDVVPRWMDDDSEEGAARRAAVQQMLQGLVGSVLPTNAALTVCRKCCQYTAPHQFNPATGRTVACERCLMLALDAMVP
jgi:hypothetical protein